MSKGRVITLHAFAVIAVLLGANSFAAEGKTMDGNWGRSLSAENKVYFTWGLGDGLILGRNLAEYSAIHYLKDQEDIEASADKLLRDYTDAVRPLSHTT